MQNLNVILEGGFGEEQIWAVRTGKLPSRLDAHVRSNVIFQVILYAISLAAEVAGEPHVVSVSSKHLRGGILIKKRSGGKSMRFQLT